MKKPNYNFIFNIGSKVKVKDLDIKGKISGLHVDLGQNITYRVTYFYNMDRKEVYFEADELELIEGNDEKTMAFKA